MTDIEMQIISRISGILRPPSAPDGIMFPGWCSFLHGSTDRSAELGEALENETKDNGLVRTEMRDSWMTKMSHFRMTRTIDASNK